MVIAGEETSVYLKCVQSLLETSRVKSHYCVVTVCWHVADEDQKFSFGCPSLGLPWEISYSLSTSGFEIRSWGLNWGLES